MKIAFHFSLNLAFLALCTPMHSTAQSYGAGACSLVPDSKTCIDATPCKTNSAGETVCLTGAAIPPSAWVVPQTCWQYSYKFACAGQTINTCAAYETNPACSIIKSACSNTTPGTGQCNQYDSTYNCEIKAAKTAKVLSCNSGIFNTLETTKPESDDKSFVRAALASEMARQAATYIKGGGSIFSGVSESCKKGYGGIKDCCKSAGGASSNSQMLSLAFSAGYSGVKYVGAKVVDFASPYVFDAMYQGGQFTAGMMSSIASSSSVITNSNSIYRGSAMGTNLSEGGPSLSAYGFTYSGSATAGGGLFGGDMVIHGGTTVLEDGTLGGPGVTFNPYVFAAMVAIQVIQELASCTQDEQLLSLHKGANLSVFVGGECSNKMPFTNTCIEWTDRYCSFNSVLSKIINTQGKPQLGLSVTDCSGITTDQLSSIDFTKVDFSEFSSTLTQRAATFIPPDVKGNYTPIMQTTKQGSSQKQSLIAPSYPNQ